MLGIETIKKDLAILIAVARETDKSLSDDGKISIFEGFNIAIKAVKIWEITKNAKELVEEYKDLDETEKLELQAWFANEFNIENDKIESIVETAFAVLVEMSELITAFKGE